MINDPLKHSLVIENWTLEIETGSLSLCSGSSRSESASVPTVISRGAAHKEGELYSGAGGVRDADASASDVVFRFFVHRLSMERGTMGACDWIDCVDEGKSIASCDSVKDVKANTYMLFFYRITNERITMERAYTPA